MRTRIRWIVVSAAAGLLLLGGAEVLQAAAAPAIYSATLGKDTATGRPVLTLVGKSLTKFKSFFLADFNYSPIEGTVDVLLKGKTTVVLGLPPVAGGDYYLMADSGTDVPWALPLSIDGGALFGGAFGAGTIPAEGVGTRMMWYPGKGAFRAGETTATEWNDANVGDYSVAMGYGTTASGNYATAMGIYSRASGDRSTALGQSAIASAPGSTALGVDTTASGISSTAMGQFTSAVGEYSTSMGVGTTASGNYSTAMGATTIASGYSSTAMGTTTNAGGYASTAMGVATTASGFGSTAMGQNSTAIGSYSTAIGEYATALAYGSLALGRFNVVAGNPGVTIATDPVLVVGNGASQMATSNAFTLLNNGNLTIAGTLTQASDLRMKKDVAPLTGVLSRIAGIRGVSYEFRDTTRAPEGRQIGLVAQEVQAAFPELVREDAQGTLSVSYQNFTAVLLEAVKEQQAELQARDGEVAALKKRLEDTDLRISRLEALLQAGGTPVKGK